MWLEDALAALRCHAFLRLRHLLLLLLLFLHQGICVALENEVLLLLADDFNPNVLRLVSVDVANLLSWIMPSRIPWDIVRVDLL